MFYLWRRRDKETRQRVWRLFGWYSGLMLLSSCFGVVTWSYWMMYLANFFKGNDFIRQGSVARGLSFYALSYSFLPVLTVSHAIVVPCASAAKLMVLDRMSDFVAPQGDVLRRHWVAGGRIVMVAVVMANVAGVVATLVASVHYRNASEAMSQASDYFGANNTLDGLRYRTMSVREIQIASSIRSVQSFCEVAVLLLVVAVFVLAGLVCAHRFATTLRAVDAASAAAVAVRSLRFRILATTACVFVALLIRCTVATMFAVGEHFQNGNSACPGASRFCDAECFNVFTLIWQWMVYTPEFVMTSITVSSPIALLAALWGMTPQSFV